MIAERITSTPAYKSAVLAEVDPGSLISHFVDGPYYLVGPQVPQHSWRDVTLMLNGSRTLRPNSDIVLVHRARLIVTLNDIPSEIKTQK